jgi:magnesium chelatase subunit D
LTERLGLFLSLHDLAHGDLLGPDDPLDLDTARDRLPKLTCTAEQADTLVIMAAKLGIDSLRAPLFALSAARSIAALLGNNSVTSYDLSLAAELTFAHRAVFQPESAEEAPAPPDAPKPEPGSEAESDTSQNLPDEILLEAVKASLPPDVLAQLADARRTRTKPTGSGSGARHRGNRRGRPVQSRPGRPGSDARVDLIATLRAAAPWQTIRKQSALIERTVHIRKDDIRLRRYETRSDRLLIFTVDASGSAAMARLAEAKGAIEILLGEAYARRDHVALVAFRGEGAELLLSPTRSLVQTKRRLQALPGGGGTPLAAGLKLALETAHTASARGMTPTVVLLTDGRANIALDGTANRGQASSEADEMARLIDAAGVSALVIDTALRPQPALNALSQTLSAPYIALPRADAHRLSDAVRAATDG